MIADMNARYEHAASTCVCVLQLEKWALDAEAHTLELAAMNRQLRAALAHAQKASNLLSNAAAQAVAALNAHRLFLGCLTPHPDSLQATA